MDNTVSAPTAAQIRRLFALGYRRGWSPARVRAFALEKFGKPIERLNWIEVRELAKLM